MSLKLAPACAILPTWWVDPVGDTGGVDLLDELRTLITRHAVGQRGPSRRLIDGVQVSRVEEPSGPTAGVLQPSVTIVASGIKQTFLNGVGYEYRAGQFLVTSLDLPVIGQALKASPDEPFVVVSIRLDPMEIAPLLLETPARPPQYGGLVVSDATPELLDPVVRLLRIVDRPEDVRVLAAGIRREILWRLLTGEQGALVRQIGLADGMLAHISRAIRWIRRHHSEPLLVADLAELAGMSSSTFHRHFRAATSMTPIQFQKQIRMQEARILLRTQALTAAEVAYQVGYTSPAHFTRTYHQAFGRTPGEDRTLP
ncbi:MAG TPA: AraC family transcriptional regulator [Kribbella sp.]|uniref:AraC family transcriptional regulator n=1 Tax=Kribbella sp. TaxID=1871183 RepID=UPI002D76CD5C|nr:AraC family transcriptional regulator [Kribbella sp.]HET6298070.1 AraC family transcriptional regulator [Kribbella sp.]